MRNNIFINVLKKNSINNKLRGNYLGKERLEISAQSRANPYESLTTHEILRDKLL